MFRLICDFGEEPRKVSVSVVSLSQLSDWFSWVGGKFQGNETVRVWGNDENDLSPDQDISGEPTEGGKMPWEPFNVRADNLQSAHERLVREAGEQLRRVTVRQADLWLMAAIV